VSVAPASAGCSVVSEFPAGLVAPFELVTDVSGVPAG